MTTKGGLNPFRPSTYAEYANGPNQKIPLLVIQKDKNTKPSLPAVELQTTRKLYTDGMEYWKRI